MKIRSLNRFLKIMLGSKDELRKIAKENTVVEPIRYTISLALIVLLISITYYKLSSNYPIGTGSFFQAATFSLYFSVFNFIALLILSLIMTSLLPFFSSDEVMKFTSSMKVICYSYSPIYIFSILRIFSVSPRIFIFFMIYAFYLFWLSLEEIIFVVKKKRLLLLLFTLILSFLLMTLFTIINYLI